MFRKNIFRWVEVEFKLNVFVCSAACRVVMLCKMLRHYCNKSYYC